MAYREGSYSLEIHSVFVETNLGTRLTLPVQNDEIIIDFRENLCKVHKQVFPEIGEISVSALKVKRRGEFFYLTDFVNVVSTFAGISKSWYMYVDAVRVEKCEQLRLTAVDQNLELVERKEDISIDSVLVDGNTKILSLEEGLETGVAEKKSRKRKLKSSDVETSRKKSSIGLNQSGIASRKNVVTTREKGHDNVMGAIGKDIVSKQKNNISMEENQQTSDADKQCQEIILTVNSGLVEEHTSGEVQDVPFNQNHKEVVEIDLATRKSNDFDESHKTCDKAPVEKLDDLRGTTEHGLEYGGKTAELVKRDQKKNTAPTSELLVTSRDNKNESNIVYEDVQLGVASMIPPIGKDNEGGEPSAAKNLQTDEVVTYSENQMEASSGMTTGTATEKKRKRTKSSKDHIKQSAAGATTTSRKTVDEINEVPGDVDCVGASLKSCPISETLENPIVEAIQKESEMGVDSVEDVRRNNLKADNLHSENRLEANSGLTTSPVMEKEETCKKSSKAATSISTAVTTASREIVNEINRAPGNVNHVDATSESCLSSRKENLLKENEMGEKITENVGSRKAVPSSADDIQTDSLVSYPENQLEVSSGLTTGPAKEKQRRQKKSAKDHINQSTGATTISKEVLNEREKVSGGIDRVDASSEFVSHLKEEKLANTVADVMQNENEMGFQESKTLDHIGKFKDENTSREHEVSKEKVEIDADQAKSVKSTEKKSSRKAKSPAKEDTSVDSGARMVEPIKVVDGEGPDNVIRNVLDSLQQKNKTAEILDKSRKKSKKRLKKIDSLQQMNETEENLKEIGKKSSRRSKKEHTSITVEPQELLVGVKNAAQEEAPLINNPKDTDVSFTPAKDIESDASHVKKIIEVANNPEDNNPSKQIIKENTDMGDNFGSIQNNDLVGGVNKQDQVTGGAKSKEEKKSLDLHPGGSIDGSVKPKAKKSKVQPTSSRTSHLQSKAKNDPSETKFDNSGESVKGTVKNRKETVKKSSKSATMKKSKVNVNSTNDAVKKSSNTVAMNVTKMNFFKDAENWNSGEEESETTSYVSAKTPSESSSDDDSDVTSMSRKQGNNLAGGTNRILGSFQDILRSSKSYKKAKLTASQSKPDEFDCEALDFVPDSRPN